MQLDINEVFVLISSRRYTWQQQPPDGEDAVEVLSLEVSALEVAEESPIRPKIQSEDNSTFYTSGMLSVRTIRFII